MTENNYETLGNQAELTEEASYHPGLEPGVDFIYGGDQDQYTEKEQENNE